MASSPLIVSPTMEPVPSPATSVTSDIALSPIPPLLTSSVTKAYDRTPSQSVTLQSHRGHLHWPETRSSRVASHDARQKVSSLS